jgi:hypothetical protein
MGWSAGDQCRPKDPQMGVVALDKSTQIGDAA